MSTKPRKRKAASPGKPCAGLRRDVQEAIDRAWPDGIVQRSFHSEESYFREVHLKLSKAFHRIRNARLISEREGDGIERSRSYHLFFVSPEGKAFNFETEAAGARRADKPSFLERAKARWGERQRESKS